MLVQCRGLLLLCFAMFEQEIYATNTFLRTATTMNSLQEPCEIGSAQLARARQQAPPLALLTMTSYHAPFVTGQKTQTLLSNLGTS